MAPLSVFHYFGSLGGFAYPTRCSTPAHSTETGSHNSQVTPCPLDETIPKMTHTVKASSRPTQTSEFSDRQETHANTLTTVLGQVPSLTETRHAAASNPSAVVTTASTTLAATHSSSPSNSLLSDTNLPSMTPAPPHSSLTLTDYTSTKIGLAFLGAVLLIAAFLCAFIFGLPKYCEYMANRRARNEAQVAQQKWWDWIKADHAKPWISVGSREIELPQMQHLSATSPAVLEDVAAMSPLRVSSEASVGSWPLRSVNSQSAPLQPSISMSFPTPSLGLTHLRSPSFGSRHDPMRSYETYKNDFHQVYARSNRANNPYHSPTVVMGLEDAKVVRMRSASPDVVKITKSGALPLSFVASIGGNTDDGFGEVAIEHGG